MEGTLIGFLERKGVPTSVTYVVLAILLFFFLWPRIRDFINDVRPAARRLRREKERAELEKLNAERAAKSQPVAPAVSPSTQPSTSPLAPPAITAAATEIKPRAPSEGAIQLAVTAAYAPYVFIACSKNPAQGLPNLFEPIFFTIWWGGMLAHFAMWAMKKYGVMPTIPRAVLISQIPIMVLLTIHFLNFLHKLIIR